MAQGKIIGSASYGPLEDAFAAELAEVANRPGASVWVLVPTNLLALHLRRAAARRISGVAGVEFVTLKDVARRMALPSLALQGYRPLPAAAVALLVRGLLEGVPDGSYFAAFRRFSNGAPAIVRTVELLENSLWTPEALREASGIARFRDPGAAGRLSELAGIWADLRSWKAENGFFGADDVVLAAGRDNVEPSEHADVLFIYGFYDFNPAQRTMVRRLMSMARRCSVYVLWEEHDGGPAPGFEYAWPTVRWLREVLGADGAQPAPCRHSGSDLDRLVEGLFKEPRILSGRPPARGAATDRDTVDGTVRIVACPGEPAEAAEVARQVLRCADQGGERLSVSVLLRGAREMAGLLAETFERAGIRCYMREGLPLAESVTGRVTLTLLELAAGDAERAAVVDFLGLAQVDWPSGLSASSLDRLSRQAGILEGPRQWKARLAARADRLHRKAQRSEDETERRTCERDAVLCTTAAGFLGEFSYEVEGLASCSSWDEVARRLRSLVNRFAPTDDEGAGPVLEVIDGLGRLDVTGVRPAPGRVRWVVGRQLAQQSLKRERFGHVGVCVSSIMGSRGTAADVVIVPGLVEKKFPRHVPEHSLLTELDREALGQVASQLRCGELPLQKDRPKEERYLFRIALGSARRAVVLTYCRLEQDTGRPKIPSRFVADVCGALGAGETTAGLKEAPAANGGALIRRVPLNRRAWGPEDMKLALDAFEYDAAVFAGSGGAYRSLAYMAAISDFFGRAARMERARWGARDFGPYDGKIGATDLLEDLQQKHSRFGSAISPTRFETYAQCPFAYFLTYVLGIEEVEAPSEEFELPAMERGLLVHDLLRLLYEERLKGRPLGELSPQDIEAATGRASRMLDELGWVHATNHPAAWAAERERTLDELRSLLAHERDRHGEAAPGFFEYEFGMASEAGYVLQLGRGASVGFRGRIDRVDALPGGAIQVVDYKTGKGSGLRNNTLLGGRQLQLPIYLLAAAELMGAQSGSSLYLLVSEPRDVPQLTLAQVRERMADFRRALRLIVAGIAAGDFFPLPAEGAEARGYCGSYCRYGIVCGAARRNLAEMKQTDPGATRLRELRDID